MMNGEMKGEVKKVRAQLLFLLPLLVVVLIIHYSLPPHPKKIIMVVSNADDSSVGSFATANDFKDEDELGAINSSNDAEQDERAVNVSDSDAVTVVLDTPNPSCVEVATKKTRDKRPPPPQPENVKPDKPNDPKWRILRLDRPRYLANGDGEIEWVWWYYYHKGSRKVSYFPPPPAADPVLEEEDTDDVICTSIDLTTDNLERAEDGNIKLANYFVKPPTKNSYPPIRVVSSLIQSFFHSFSTTTRDLKSCQLDSHGRVQALTHLHTLPSKILVTLYLMPGTTSTYSYRRAPYLK